VFIFEVLILRNIYRCRYTLRGINPHKQIEGREFFAYRNQLLYQRIALRCLSLIGGTSQPLNQPSKLILVGYGIKFSRS